MLFLNGVQCLDDNVWRAGPRSLVDRRVDAYPLGFSPLWFEPSSGHMWESQDVLGFNDTSTLMGHFVSSPREGEKRDRRGDEREGQGRKRYRNEREETEEIKTFPSTLTCYKDTNLAQLKANIIWTPRWRKIYNIFATPDYPGKAKVCLRKVRCFFPLDTPVT